MVMTITNGKQTMWTPAEQIVEDYQLHSLIPTSERQEDFVLYEEQTDLEFGS